MMRHDSANSRMQEVQAMLNDQVKMQTIMEMDIEDRFIERLDHSTEDASPENAPNVNLAVNTDISVSSAEDEANKTSSSQAPLAPYRSYRALSDIKELNNLIKLADKRKSSSKSNEMLVRKSLFIGGSSPLLQPQDRMRSVRSCENVNKSKVDSSEMIDFGTLRRKEADQSEEDCDSEIRLHGEPAMQPLINITSSSQTNINDARVSDGARVSDVTRVSKSREALQYLEKSFADDSTIGSQYKKDHQESCFNTLDSDNRTIVPDDNNATAATTSDNNTIDRIDNSNHHTAYRKEPSTERDATTVPNLFPTYQDNALGHLPAEVGTSQDDIVRWLHDTTSRDGAPSISSDEYRSSMCSSMNDLHSGLPSCRSSVSSSVSSRPTGKRRDTADSLLGNYIH